ncbi:hypothetical protein I302_108610 [Kwoniella bestiolae CBS 10118]|uniref:Uncharacterized protein n=1 Tax=Kwoniella bestiolae CBS 10118 TaxID=1296100 RepID=A0A1B9FTL2_9TREE|nr:hypothetical protein I302_07748 [Kwoniella bestiolae CBS 10118]OCF22106.1 hypothetical protein I302_07748 [Kwoniella bestiolae CBS 10118]
MHEALYGWDRKAQRRASSQMNELCYTAHKGNPDLNEIKNEWIEITSNTKGSQHLKDEGAQHEYRKRYMDIYERTHDLTDEERTMFRAIHEPSKPDRLTHKKRFMDGIEQVPEPANERSAEVRSAWSEIHSEVNGRKVSNQERRKRWWDLVEASDHNRRDSRARSTDNLVSADELEAAKMVHPLAKTATASPSEAEVSSTPASPGGPANTGTEGYNASAARKHLEEIVKKFGKEWTMSQASLIESDCKTDGTSHLSQTAVISQEA